MNLFRRILQRFFSFVRQYPIAATAITVGAIATTVVVYRSIQTTTMPVVTNLDSTQIEKKIEFPPPQITEDTLAPDSLQHIPEESAKQTDSSVVEKKKSLGLKPDDSSSKIPTPIVEAIKESLTTVPVKKDSLSKTEKKSEQQQSLKDTSAVTQITSPLPKKDTTVAVFDSSTIEKIPPIEIADDKKDGEPESIDSTKSKDQLITEKSDTIGLAKDTIPRLSVVDSIALGFIRDTSYVVENDSTERIRQWNDFQTPALAANPFRPKQHSFALNINHPAYQREVKLDSSGKFVSVRETWYGEDIRVPITLSLEEYTTLRIENEQQRLWEDSVYFYQFKATGQDALGSLFSSITNIDIPVPANPLFSIFGPPRINLRVSGAVDIHAGFRTQKSDLVSTSLSDQQTTDPNFNQEVQVNVNGTIGDKLNILADWNTQRVFEYENQLKLKYTGYDDEIVQSVEAGNVSMSAPGYFGSSAALFGVKAKMQFGPITLYSLASQKKGQIREVSVKGGATEKTFDKRAYDYSPNHYFLDTLYRPLFETYYSSLNPTYDPEFQVKDIEVWVMRRSGAVQPGDRNAVAWIDLPSYSPNAPIDPLYDSLRNIQSAANGDTVAGNFYRLERNADYIINDATGYISFLKNLNTDQAIAVAYRREGISNSPNDDLLFGEFIGNDTTNRTIILKLIRPINLLPFHKAWKLQLRNIFSLDAKNLKEEGFELKIFFERDEEKKESINPLGTDIKLLTILGLDKRNAQRSPPPDGNFDFVPFTTVNTSRGEVIFPTLEPFDETIFRYFITNTPTSGDSLLLDDYIYPQVYDSLRDAARTLAQSQDVYIIRGKYTAEVTSRYPLGFNVVEGSVKVTANGTPMAQGIDFTVDYILGEIIIKNDAALVPGADLKITYEQNDLFQLASKTQLGARAEMEPLPNTTFGATIMNLNQATLSDKVRLGEEPTNNTMMGFDASTNIRLPIVTDALNALPLYQTREISELRVSAEAAYMDPTPNTKKSTIAGERDKSIAYIDDFEGAQRTIPLGTTFGQWHLASPPKRYGTPDTTVATYRSKLMWYNVPRDAPNAVRVEEIWPNKSVSAGEDIVSVLDLTMIPNERGMYNYTNVPATTARRDSNWAGIMRPLSSSSNNLVEQNMSFIELWMKIENNSDPFTGKLIIDLGQISEDIIPNNILETEDTVFYSVPNNILNVDKGEDVGLDMATGGKEGSIEHIRGRLKQVVDSAFIATQSDPSGDNFAYTYGSQNYSQINGLEKNELRNRKPDTEDLNNNNFLDTYNDYFQYELNLDTMDAFNRNQYIVGGGTNGWYQFRIPLTEPNTRIGSPDLRNVEYLRAYLTGFSNSTSVTIRIADFNIVGNQWQELIRQDSTLRTSVVNVEDNPDYVIPPGVQREKDKTKPDQNIQFNEQALALLVRNMPDAANRLDSSKYQAIRYFPSNRPLDVFNYKQMKMFVHAERYNPATGRGFRYDDSLNYDAEIFIRFGSDTSNFYEYRAPLHPSGLAISPESQWSRENNVTIDFGELTSLKQGRDSASQFRLIHQVVKNGPVGAKYGIRGFPALNNIRYFGIGVTNPSNNPQASRHPLDIDNVVSGDVWVNELRLVGVEDTPGWAYRFNTSLKLADLGAVSFSYAKSDPFFHGLEQRFNTTKETSYDMGMNVSLNFDKFFPQDWQGTTLPVSYTYSERHRQPRYFPNTDVLVTSTIDRLKDDGENPTYVDSVFESTQSFSTSHVIALPTIRLVFPTSAWYIDQTINRLSFAANYNTSQERNPVILDKRQWSWNGRIGYDLSLPTDYFVQPFKALFADVPLLRDFKEYKLFYAPGRIQWNVDANRGISTEIPRAKSKTSITSNFRSNRSFGFGWKLSENGLLNLNGSYALTAESVPTHLEQDTLTHRLYSFSTVIRKIFPKHTLVDLGKDSRYGQNVTVNSRPTLPNVFDIPKYLTLSAGYRVDYGWSTNFQGELGQGAGWTNQIDLGFDFKLKQLADTWFPESKSSTPAIQPPRIERGRGREMKPKGEVYTDSLKLEEKEDSTSTVPSVPFMEKLGSLARMFLKSPLLDYDNITVTYSQTNKMQNSGIAGDNATGLHNFWGTSLFSGSQTLNGPSALYQLGLSKTPAERRAASYYQYRDTVVNGDTVQARYLISVRLTDDYSQTNKLTLKTQRNLWEGASISLNWNLGWANNQNETFNTDTLGFVIPNSRALRQIGSVDRSYFSFPIPLFKSSKDYLKSVGEKVSATATTGTSTNEKVAQAFEEGLETFPFLRTLFGELVPRANYSLRWGGLERISYFKNIFTSLSLEHTYQSTFGRAWTVQPNGSKKTERTKITYGFQPLLRLNANFIELWKGNVTASLGFNTTTDYDLALTSNTIEEKFTQEIQGNITYAKRGFEIPLFGFSLKNDIDFSFAFSLSTDSRTSYNVFELETDQEGIPRGGTTRTQFEPRIKYILSSRVSLAIFYRYTRIKPDEGGSNIPGSTTNEAGLDLRISIQ